MEMIQQANKAGLIEPDMGVYTMHENVFCNDYFDSNAQALAWLHRHEVSIFEAMVHCEADDMEKGFLNANERLSTPLLLATSVVDYMSMEMLIEDVGSKLNPDDMNQLK